MLIAAQKGEEVSMRQLIKTIAELMKEVDRELAVMRGEEPVPGPQPGVDWARQRGEEKPSGRRCRGASRQSRWGAGSSY